MLDNTSNLQITFTAIYIFICELSSNNGIVTNTFYRATCHVWITVYAWQCLQSCYSIVSCAAFHQCIHAITSSAQRIREQFLLNSIWSTLWTEVLGLKVRQTDNLWVSENGYPANIWIQKRLWAYMLQSVVWQRNKPALNAGPRSTQTASCRALWNTAVKITVEALITLQPKDYVLIDPLSIWPDLVRN